MEGLELKICEFNVENLFVSMDYYEGQDLERMTEEEWRAVALAQLQKKQKPLSKLWGLSKAILDIDADILMLVEVGGRDSLENFSRHFLKDVYEPVFLEGNSKRNIDLGFLVKRGLSLQAKGRSNKNTPIEVNTFQGRQIAKFSRDVAELRLYDGHRLKLILLLTHLKSMLSTEQDFRGKDTRTAEANALAEIYSKRRETYPNVPVILGGDLNNDLASLEFELLKRTDIADFHEVLGTPRPDRVSLVYFDYADRPHGLVIDYLLISPHLRDRIVPGKSFTYRYKGLYDVVEELPQTPKQRYQMPSDHFPVVLTIRL